MILVTGGTGLVGAHLLYQLAKNDENIRAIYRSSKKIEAVKKVFYNEVNGQSLFDKITWFKADITDVPAMIPAFTDVKKVYHCAAFISFNPKDYRKMRKVNIHGTANIANLAIDAKVDKICFVGSIAAVGNSLYDGFITEESEWNSEDDNSGYSITKFGAEMEIWRASQEGVNVVIVNPGVILGSGFFKTGSGALFSNINSGLQYYTEGITGYVGVNDVVKCMVLLMNSTIKNERFILVSENNSYKEIFSLIAKYLGKKAPKIRVKKWQTAIFWRIALLISKFTKKDPLLTKYTAKSAHTISKYSSKKIKEALDFQFEEIETVIKKVCISYKNKDN